MKDYIANLHLRYGKIFNNVISEIRSDISKLDKSEIEDYLKSRLSAVAADAALKSDLYKSECSCVCCGECCRFAVSQFSYDELIKKSKLGDEFAKQFVSIFIPYKNESEYRQIFPDYVYLLKEYGVCYFYHCKNVTPENRCCVYEQRPQICKDFPDDPIGFLPLSCSFKAWKLKSEPVWLKLRAEKEIINYILNGN